MNLRGIAVAVIGLVVCGCSDDEAPDVSTSELVERLCEDLAAKSCETSVSEEECLLDWQSKASASEENGCTTLLEEYLSCATSNPVYCGGAGMYPQYPVVSDECFRVEFFECLAGATAECGVYADDESCGIKCPESTSRCVGPDPNGPVSCVCETGPHADTAFDSPNCGPDLVALMEENCL